MTTATVILDSVAPDGTRLTTMEWRFPRFILAEVNTHRRFSRNSASSRALPLQAQIRRVWDDPFVPERFTSAQKGMQGGDALTTEDQRDAAHQWRVGAYHAAATAREELARGLIWAEAQWDATRSAAWACVIGLLWERFCRTFREPS